MSIFGSIMGAIFGHAQQAQPAGTQSGQPHLASQGGTAQAHPAAGAKPAAPGQAPHAGAQQQTHNGGQPQAPAQHQAAPAQPQQRVDVEAVLNKLKSDKHANLDWQHSIVDLMKLLDLDSSLQARQELAKELHYTGDMHDSAHMNVWLHKQVMTRLAENGGKVPDSLKN